MLMTFVMHRVVKDAPIEWADISSSTLKSMLDIICEKKISVTTAAVWQGEPAVCLSFDDGSSSDYSIVYPQLVARGLRATFFIVPEWVGTPGYLEWHQIREMHDAGMEIGSHGLSHLQMSCLPRDQAWLEFDVSKRCIEDRLGAPVSTFAYPFGDYSGWCHRLGLEAGYRRLCSSRPGVARNADIILPRVAVNRRHTSVDLPRLIEPSLMYLRWLGMFDRSRTIAKAVLGKKTYIRLRNTFY